MFAKLKALLRKAEERTIDDLWARIGTLLAEISTQECAKLLRQCRPRRHLIGRHPKERISNLQAEVWAHWNANHLT
jgi:hypothetical protein